MITQAQISVVLKDLPTEFSIDELMDKLILAEKIKDAVQQGERGETYSTEEAQALLQQWSKYDGRGGLLPKFTRRASTGNPILLLSLNALPTPFLPRAHS